MYMMMMMMIYSTHYPANINQSERMFTESLTFPQLPAHDVILKCKFSEFQFDWYKPGKVGLTC